MKKFLRIGWVGFIWMNTLCICAQMVPSGDVEIDRMRAEVVAEKTNEKNFRERHLLLYMWMGALQQQGADTRSFFELDKSYYRLEPLVNRHSQSDDQDVLGQGLPVLRIKKAPDIGASFIAPRPWGIGGGQPAR